MRNHTLMQTIARANRVFRDKVNGLIVDYVGVFRNLQRALTIYGSGSGGGVKEGETPVKDKSALVEELKQTIGEATAFCVDHGIDLNAIQAAGEFERIRLLVDAVDAIVVTEETKRRYLLLTGTVTVLYKAILPDPMANDLGPRCVLLGVIAKMIRNLTPETDISEVMEKVEDLLDESIDAKGYVIREPSVPYGKEHFVDLSKIDFEALKAKFERGRKYTQAERLKGTINNKLKKLVRLNRTRMDYLERFQEMIDAYNAGSMNIDEFFKQLVAFAQELDEEEKRGLAEDLSEEELAVFDLLTKPEMKLTGKEELQVKRIARELLETLKRGKLVLDWRKRQQSRAEVRVTIEDILDRGLPEVYKQELYDRKCDTIYQHVYDSYYGAGKSVYVQAA
jgi:type I restriction enzyme R subunit